MYLSEILSSFICGKPDFDPQVRYLAKRSIVDTMGAMLAGSCTDVVKQLLPVYNAPGCCTLVGLKGTVNANNAAFLNGISGHELELDDTSSSNLGHPTVAVLPSVLAAGEERAASGEEVLKAFILATEVECKIGRITTVDGRVLTRERVYPDGHLTHPIPDQGIHDKYMKSALPVLGQEKAEELYRRLMALEEERDIRALLALCR